MDELPDLSIFSQDADIQRILAGFDPSPDDMADAYVDRAVRLVRVAKALVRAEFPPDRSADRVLAVAIVLTAVMRVFQELYGRERLPPVADLDSVLSDVEAWIERKAYTRYLRSDGHGET